MQDFPPIRKRANSQNDIKGEIIYEAKKLPGFSRIQLAVAHVGTESRP